ncbi:MAG: hypothetical protein R3C68_05045 [Myxococcota bacterium]
MNIPEDAWYLTSNRQAHLPFSVLPNRSAACGWLAAYVGSALTSEVDLRFRNLGSDAVLHAQCPKAASCSPLGSKLTGVSSSVGMIIQHYDFAVFSDVHGAVYDNENLFWLLRRSRLRNSGGDRDAKLYSPGLTHRL